MLFNQVVLRRLSKLATLDPTMLTVFVLEPLPEIISTAPDETPKARANNRTSAKLAAPSTGGAASRTHNAPSCSPTISVREERGTTRTLNVSFPSFSE